MYVSVLLVSATAYSAQIWYLLCKDWLKSLYLINQSETINNDVRNDIQLHIYF